ncbi:PREDICTED: translation initiation factor IF-2-like [Ficedula albicollis]|uniref:translation initiation factor IF-2-like n=1 Tax=Ficedula albicollis TaxID=59894 RepID=UPI0007AD8ACC|nr:PREDICTED: translation initiation factor IF-2-like [Ficedula albicollis]
MVTACLWGPELLATSWEGPGERLGAVAGGAQGGGSTVRRETGRDEGVPLPRPAGVRAAAPGTSRGACPGIPSQAWGPMCPASGEGSRVLPARDGPGSARPRAGFIAGGRAGGPSSAARGAAGDPRGQRGLGGGSLSSGHEDAWSDGAHPGTETLMRGRGPAGPRHRRASGGDGGTRQGGPCPARAFVHAPGDPRARRPGMGSCGQGAWLCALGLAQGGRGQGDGSVGDEGRRAEAYWGPLGEQKGQGRGHGGR